MRRAARWAWIGGWMAFMCYSAWPGAQAGIGDKLLSVAVFGLWGGVMMSIVVELAWNYVRLFWEVLKQFPSV